MHPTMSKEFAGFHFDLRAFGREQSVRTDSSFRLFGVVADLASSPAEVVFHTLHSLRLLFRK